MEAKLQLHQTTPPPDGGKIITTYSQWNLFRNCRKAYEYRYRKHYRPKETEEPLWFGSLIHKALESWHGEGNVETVRSLIDAEIPTHIPGTPQHDAWHKAHAMMSGYIARYPVEPWVVCRLEAPFIGEIVNPDTQAVSRTFCLAGKVDGIVYDQNTGVYYILEHKTASQISEDYLAKLWMDFQSIIYAHMIEKTYNLPIAGVIYNVIEKSKIKQSQGETEAEFEARRAELIAKSKTGKSSAKQKIAETDEEFAERLKTVYSSHDKFHRQTLYFSADQVRNIQSEIWELTQAYLFAQKREHWYQNTSYCYNYNRPCPYLPICQSGENQMMIDLLYDRQLPNEELRDTEIYGNANARDAEKGDK